MAYADSIKYNSIRSMKGLPIGAIVPWSSDQGTIPVGWVACNGVTVPNNRYPLLFKSIGNVYGGTVGSSFRLPPLTNSQKAIVDIFVGHHNYLRGNSAEFNSESAHAPETSSINIDPFWTIIANGDGNEGSSSQTSWVSTIDLVGRINGSPSFIGIYDNMEVADGEFSYTVTWTDVALGDRNLSIHSHGLDTEETTSYLRGNLVAREVDQNTRGASGTKCQARGDRTPAWRVAANPADFIATSRGNNPRDLANNFLFTQPNTGTTGTGGGGGLAFTTQLGQTSAIEYEGGDGICGGQMNCNGVLFTGLSNQEGAAGAGFGSSPHNHATNTYNLFGRFQALNPGIRTNVSLNTVRINNSSGLNYGTITVDTATPTLDMLYIIRAY
jgi:hypothetical protein